MWFLRACAMALESDFESLPSSSRSVHLLAGATAGIMEHIALYPVDLVKTRLQSSFTPERQSLRSILASIAKKEGFCSLYRGVSSVVFGAGPAHAAYFGIYEEAKVRLAPLSNKTSSGEALVHGISGALATLGHDFVMNPMEVLKQRLQIHPHRYSGLCDCLRKISNYEGYRAFYRSFPVQLAMNFPFNSTNFIVYEYMRKNTIGKSDYNLLSHLISGGTAGGVAAVITTPLDVIKTTLNVQDPKLVEISKKCNRKECVMNMNSYKITGVKNAAMTVYQAGGFRGFFNGMVARFLISVPSCAISWGVYETFKYLLTD